MSDQQILILIFVGFCSDYQLRPAAHLVRDESNSKIISRRRRKHATFAIDEDVMIRAHFLLNRPLGDEGSGAGPPAASIHEDVDLAEVNDLVTHPTFDIGRFESHKMDDRLVASQDDWTLSLIGKSFKRKELEFEDDFDLKAKGQASVQYARYAFPCYTCDGANRKFTPSSVRRARESLRFVCRAQ